MALVYNQDMNFNGSSEVNDGDTRKVVVSLSASYRDANRVYIGKSFEDIGLYKSNKEAVDADCENFEKKVLEDISKSAKENM